MLLAVSALHMKREPTHACAVLHPSVPIQERYCQWCPMLDSRPPAASAASGSSASLARSLANARAFAQPRDLPVRIPAGSPYLTRLLSGNVELSGCPMLDSRPPAASAASGSSASLARSLANARAFAQPRDLRFESLQGHRISRVSLAETLNCQGAPCWIRTNGLLLRRQTLSSPELMGRNAVDYSERRCFLPHYTQVSFAHRNESTCAFPMLVPCAHVPQVNLDGNETPCPQIGIHCTDTVSSVRTCGHAAKGVP